MELSGPNPDTPRLGPGVVRRTSTIDLVWHDVRNPGAADGEGAALRMRTLVRDPGGTCEVIALMGPRRTLVGLSIDGRPQGQALLGTPLSAGFRAAALDAFPGTRWTALGAALDDLPVAVVVAGYCLQRTAALDQEDGRSTGTTQTDLHHLTRAALGHMTDLCSGWQASGETVQLLRSGELMSMQRCPPAPPLGDGWHDLPQLPPAAMRRHRRTDVQPDGTVSAMFRDVFIDPDGTPVVLHEYDVAARVVDGVVRDPNAVPRVLPFSDCHLAAQSTRFIRDVPVVEISRQTHQSSIGIAGCTHLTDCLRQLEAVPFLAALAEGLSVGGA